MKRYIIAVVATANQMRPDFTVLTAAACRNLATQLQNSYPDSKVVFNEETGEVIFEGEVDYPLPPPPAASPPAGQQ